jgi:hypothetical protein
MGFEVFVQCFTQGERDGVAVTDIQRVFGPQLEAGENEWWKVVYDEQNSCDILVDYLSSDKDFVHFISVQRPCGDRRLWEALFSVLEIGHCVLYFPADRPPLLVANESMTEHLPPDMVDSMGAITRVNCAQDILDAIQRA